MKKTVMILLAISILTGCASSSTLTTIEMKHGDPARVEIECIDATVCDENTYYTNRSNIKHIYWFYYWKDWRMLEYCWEVKANREGKVIGDRTYYEQKSTPSSGRILIRPTNRKLPGVE